MAIKKVHKEGYKIIATSFLILFVLNLCVYYFTGLNWILYSIGAISLVLFSMIVYFFRNMTRIYTGEMENMIIAPADGKVVVLEEVVENEHFHDERIQVSIFMSPFNAHMNWVPANGKVLKYFHQNGRFKAAYLPKSSTENERSTVVIRTTGGHEILLRQIAGAMAKRIVTYVEGGEECQINEQLGFIKFGSRVDLFLPMDSEIRVELGQKVLGNHTVIAKLK
ncbi:phosphatidylserine decarboxylase family protein [Bacteroidales bacterium OttesenSCG-928-L03]|nr:phosphatidylserine decarboxylase family protein [Bacteroidales bacterium OttesenSCG-928-L03]